MRQWPTLRQIRTNLMASACYATCRMPWLRRPVWQDHVRHPTNNIVYPILRGV